MIFGGIGFINYVAVLFLITGGLIVTWDVGGYILSNMKKEIIVSRWLGWLNISLGVIIFLGLWIYNKWLW